MAAGFGYVPFPADSAVAFHLRELDFECVEAAGSLDSSLFLETLEQRGATVCGSGPVSLLLDVMQLLAAMKSTRRPWITRHPET